MTVLIAYVSALLAAHPWLIVPIIALVGSVLATLYTMARQMPDGPAKSLFLALLEFCKAIVDRFSFKPLSDAEPHFKVRGSRWKIPGPRSKKKLSIILPFLALLAFTQSGCAWWSKTAQVVASCVTQTVKDAGAALLPVIAEILMYGQDVEKDLGAIASSLGADGMLIVRCVVENLYHDWTTKPMLSPYQARGAGMAKEWLQAHK